MSCRLCQICWNYWKRYGGLKVASRLADSGDIVDTTITTGGGGGGGVAVVTTVVATGAAAGAGSPGIVSLKKTPQRVISGTGTGTGSAGSDIDDDLTIVASSGPIGSLDSGGLSNHRPHR